MHKFLQEFLILGILKQDAEARKDINTIEVIDKYREAFKTVQKFYDSIEDLRNLLN